MKSRGVYETPGGTILYEAHKALEQICLERDLYHFKQQVAVKYGELVYYGQWFHPLRESLQAFVDHASEVVTGTVRVKLFKGRAAAVSATSPRSLYDTRLASFAMRDYDVTAARGFIDLFGLPMKVRGVRQGRWARGRASKRRRASGPGTATTDRMPLQPVPDRAEIGQSSWAMIPAGRADGVGSRPPGAPGGFDAAVHRSRGAVLVAGAGCARDGEAPRESARGRAYTAADAPAPLQACGRPRAAGVRRVPHAVHGAPRRGARARRTGGGAERVPRRGRAARRGAGSQAQHAHRPHQPSPAQPPQRATALGRAPRHRGQRAQRCRGTDARRRSRPGRGRARPLETTDVCVLCHGPVDQLSPEILGAIRKSYPGDRATGFTPGQVRGWLWAEVSRR
jgi:hypothetical protein